MTLHALLTGWFLIAALFALLFSSLLARKTRGRRFWGGSNRPHSHAGQRDLNQGDEK
jgi:hypothetical protein